MKALAPEEKIQEMRQHLNRFEDMLSCLAYYDKRDISNIFPQFQDFCSKFNKFIGEEVRK